MKSLIYLPHLNCLFVACFGFKSLKHGFDLSLSSHLLSLPTSHYQISFWVRRLRRVRARSPASAPPSSSLYSFLFARPRSIPLCCFAFGSGSGGSFGLGSAREDAWPVVSLLVFGVVAQWVLGWVLEESDFRDSQVDLCPCETTVRRGGFRGFVFQIWL